MGFLAKVVLNLRRSLFLFNRATEKNTDPCTKAPQRWQHLNGIPQIDDLSSNFDAKINVAQCCLTLLKEVLSLIPKWYLF